MKTAVITGGSGYVGSAIVERLLRLGCRVINISRSPAENASVENVLCDLSNQEETRNAAQQIKTMTDTVDVFVHAACPPTTRMALEDTPPEAREREFAVAVGAAEIFAEALIPLMPSASSFIGITTASLEKETPEKNIGAYLPAKQKLRELLRRLHTDWNNRGIRVFAVAPTFLPGGLNADLPEGVRTLLARQKDGSIPTAQSVAEVISDISENAFPAGTSIEVPSKAVMSL